jgi:hypothetical protein
LWNAGTYTFLGAINDDVSDDGGVSYFSGGNYSWTENSKKYYWSEKEERDLTATNIDGILKECGFTTGCYHMAKRKRPCVIYLNLLTPVTEWLSGAGKTQINLTPFASLIAQTVSELAHKMPSCHGERLQERLDNATSEPGRLRLGIGPSHRVIIEAPDNTVSLPARICESAACTSLTL